MRLHSSLLSLMVLILTLSCSASKNTVGKQNFDQEIKAHQKELNTKYKKRATSPLEKKDRLCFKGHDFFPINENFRFDAKFIKTEHAQSFKMKTSTDREPEYVKYGELHFVHQGNDHVLNLYQNLALSKVKQYKEYLFLPFKDDTNGEESYGGGRYIDFKIPSGDVVTLDFNKSYNPYCAYSAKYSCPIPPKENYLPFAVKAGIKNSAKAH